jgi:ABC-2 type transport system ATP-binding protein
VSKSFDSNTTCAILGGNGSGKSTLLQIISGYLTPGEGEVYWTENNNRTAPEEIYKSVSLCTPFLNLYDDFTLLENVEFFLRFKKFRDGITCDSFAEHIELNKHQHKMLRHYSSGMRQRVKLGLAILADTKLLLLDEPTSHLDSNAVQWFQKMLALHASNRSIFVASNSHKEETFLCREEIVIDTFKRK